MKGEDVVFLIAVISVIGIIVLAVILAPEHKEDIISFELNKTGECSFSKIENTKGLEIEQPRLYLCKSFEENELTFKVIDCWALSFDHSAIDITGDGVNLFLSKSNGANCPIWKVIINP